MTARLLITLSILLLLAGRALAHDFWLEPATYRPAAGKALPIRLMQGEHFRGEPVQRNDARIERFVVRDASGERPVAGRTGDEPAGSIDGIAPGLSIVAYRTRPLRHGVMTADRFESYLREEGLERIIALRAERGEARRSASEIFSRSAKTLLLRPGTSATRYDEPLGLRLELIPETDPHDVKRTTITIRLLFEGRPLSGALVTAIHRHATAHARTGADGRVTLPLAKNGPWLVKSVHMLDAPEGSGVDWESVWATLTFERGGR